MSRRPLVCPDERSFSIWRFPLGGLLFHQKWWWKPGLLYRFPRLKKNDTHDLLLLLANFLRLFFSKSEGLSIDFDNQKDLPVMRASFHHMANAT